MNLRKISDTALWLFLAVGFLGALKVSYANFTGTPCPYIAFVPICYIVLVAYGLMIAALLIRSNRSKHYLFCAGWGTAFVIALVGSVAEIFAGGGVCPSAGGGSLRGASSTSIPMCFISLALTIVILVLFLLGPYKRACDLHHAKA